MSRSWWALPGPEAFCVQAARRVSAGKNLVLRLPAHLPAGTAAAVRRAGDLTWRAYTWERERGLPAEALLDRFYPELPARASRDIPALLGAERLRGVTLHLDLDLDAEKDVEAARVWLDFIREYAERTRDIGMWERPTFVLEITGAGILPLPTNGPTLDVLIWDGVISPLDMALYVAWQLKGRALAAVEKDVLQAVATELAGWDAECADRLLARALEDVLDPFETLRELARERGWEGEEEEGDLAWSRGQRDRAYTRPHAALLALNGERDALRSRVWAGQMATLFPRLEEGRRALLGEHAHRLWVPFETHDGRVVKDVRDLDLSHIVYQLRRTGALDPARLSELQVLVSVRNSLAHFEPVDADQVRARALATI